MVELKDINIKDHVILEDGSEWAITETVDCISPYTLKQVTVILGKHNNIERAIPLDKIKEVKHLNE